MCDTQDGEEQTTAVPQRLHMVTAGVNGQRPPDFGPLGEARVETGASREGCLGVTKEGAVAQWRGTDRVA